MKILSIFLVGIFCLALIGCTETEKGAGVGAAGGGLIGGIIGHQSGRTAEGAVIGVVGGAILGGLIGHSQEDKDNTEGKTIATCPNGHQVDVTGFPKGSRVRCPVCNDEFNI